MSRFTSFTGVAALFGLTLTLAACSTFESEIARLRPIKTVAVISAVGDSFTFTDAGLTGSTGGSRTSDISSWDLDPMIAREVGVLIGRRFDVQPARYRQDDFLAPDVRSPVVPVNLFRSDALAASLRKVKTDHPVDAYVVVLKAKAQTGPSNRLVEGFGAVTFHTVIGSYQELHALYEIRVVDGHDFKTIASLPAAPIGDMELSRLAGPTSMMGEGPIPEGIDAARSDTIRQGVTDLVHRSLEPTLLDLHLIGPQP